MPTSDGDDPGADTAMFRAYVEHPEEADAASKANRTLLIGVVVVIVILAVLGLVLL